MQPQHLNQKLLPLLKRAGRLSRSRKTLFFSAIAVIIFAILINHFSSSKHHTRANETEALMYQQVKQSAETLTAMQQQLNNLTISLHDENTVIDIDSLTQSLTQLSTQIDHLQQENAESLKTIMASENAVVNQKLDELKSGVTELKDLQHPIHYLPADQLPFVVQTIDLIQQQPVVTIRYANKTQPLDIGYAIAGWELIAANYREQRAEFINSDKAHIVIHLAMTGVSA